MTRASFIRAAPEMRRQSLIDAAAKCLAERGVGGASVRAICAEAGVSPGLLTHYFDGIDALIVATYRDVGARVAAAIDRAVAAADDDPHARLHAYVTANFRPPVLDPDLLATWLAFWSLVKTDKAIAAVHDEIYADFRRGIETLLRQCHGNADAREVRLGAVAITALVDGLWLELCLGSSSFSPEEASSIATRWVEALLSQTLFRSVVADR